MIKIACAGAGYFSQFHYGSWRRLNDCLVVGACDLDQSKAAATGAPAFASLVEMLTQTAPDLLDIILPPSAHAAAIRTALTAGVKWIICQKPFCTNLQEAQDISAEAQARGARLIIHENFRFQPWYRAIKSALDHETIGDVHNATFRLRPGDGQGPRAYLDRQPYFQKMRQFLIHETGVHWVDTFTFLFGPIDAVYADLRRLNPAVSGEDAGHVIFDHGPIRAVLDANRHLDHAADNLRRTMGEAWIEGTTGALTLLGDGSVLHRKFGRSETSELLRADTWDGFGGDCVHRLQAHVLQAMIEGTALENEASEYIQTIAVKDAIYASAEMGRKLTVKGPEKWVP